MEISFNFLALVVEKLDQGGYRDRSIHDSIIEYTPRGFMSRPCVGILIDDKTDMFAIGAHVAATMSDVEQDENLADACGMYNMSCEEVVDALTSCVELDSMGLGYVLYFRGIELMDKPVSSQNEDDDMYYDEKFGDGS